MNRSIHRRMFLKGAAVGGAGLLILKNSASAWSYQANQKLDIALVGVGGRGSWFVETIPRLGENVVALCDVNEHKAADAFKAFPQAAKYADFRKMLQEMDKRIDAVIVAAPDHVHAVVSMMAMRMGKHVYCEKPLTHDVHEARALREAAAKHKVATQMGNQGTAAEPFRRAIELVQGGVLGEIREVHAWNSAGGAGHREVPKESPPVPPYLNWDLWLGPARARPFHPYWLGWSSWRDFGTGVLGNWAIHSMNLAFMSLKLDAFWRADPSVPAPLRAPVVQVEAEVSEIDEMSFPKWEIVRYEFSARGGMPPVRVNWYNGSRAPGARELIESLQGSRLDWGDAGERRWKDHGGCIVVGSKGLLRLTEHNATHTLLPEEKFKDFQGPAKTVPRSPGHEREWLAACKGGPPAMSNFDYADPMTEFVLLGNVATQFPQKLEFDPMACKVLNSKEADRALRREYREGWSL